MMVFFQKSFLSFLLVLAFSDLLPSACHAFVPSFSSLSSSRIISNDEGCFFASSSSPTTTDDDFASFAASLNDNDDDDNDARLKKKKTTTNESSSIKTPVPRSWKEDLEDLLDPTTPMANRQNLLADLLSANQDIRQAVQTALREQKIDALLTPRGKRIQDGTRAVARQLTVDILPTFASATTTTTTTTTDTAAAAQSSSSSTSSSRRQNESSSERQSSKKETSSSSTTRLPIGIPVPPLPLRAPKLPIGPIGMMEFLIPPPTEMTKMGRRMWNALQREVQNNLATLQDDLADPATRIPKRVQQQTQTLLQQATNVFAETPVGLSEPPYTIYQATADYEIRDYQAYTVASTNMIPVGQVDDLYDDNNVLLQDNPGRTAAAFNTLAAYYLLGANKQEQPISNTCFPVVTTTMLGEMRFYIDQEKFGTPPEPLEQDEATTTSNGGGNSDFVYETGSIFLEQIPPARLAVRRFTGFCTAGEVARQKQALLAGLDLDSVELDVPHGGTVPHVVFQYNPPYALPVVRRNEIAVAVLDQSKAVEEASLRKITQLLKNRQMEDNNTGNNNSDDDDTEAVGAKAATTTTATVNNKAASSIKAESPPSKVTKINGSNDPIIFPDDPWGE